MNNISEIRSPEINEHNSAEIFPNDRKNLLKRIFFIGIILIIIIFSWTGTIDKASETFIDSSLKQAAVIYGTARAINATVSVLQTVSIPGLGLGVGQALDPLNSIVERFSTIMEISIGSLVIQKILIEITTNLFFSILLTISAVAILTSGILRNYFYFKLFVKIFLTLAFLRYAIVISLAVNGIISNAFIKEKITSEANIIINASTEASNDIDKVNKSKRELDELKNKSTDANGNSLALPPTQPADTPSLSPAQDKSFMDRMKGKFFGQKNTDSTQPPTATPTQKSKLEVLIDWINKQRDILTSVIDSFNPMKIADKIQNVVENMINLMAIILLQALLLPIFFMYLMKWLIFTIWNIKINDVFMNIKSDLKIK